METGRILILTNRIPYPMNDGGNMAMKAVIDAYNAQGWQVYLLSMNTSRHYISPEVSATQYKDIYAFETVDVDNDIKPLLTIKNYLFSKLPNHAERFYDKKYENMLIKVLNDFKPDAIHIESVFLSAYLPVIKQTTQAKTILRMHNIEWQIWDRLASKTHNPAKKLYLSSLAKRIKEYEVKVWKAYDLLLPITAYDASIVTQFINTDNILTIPFGIKITDKQLDNEKWYGYHIGAMDWLPNAEAIDWFIKDVWPQVHTEAPEFVFFFAGRNMPAKYKYLEVDGVNCMGEVANADDFIADKKILIVPLRSGGGVRIKILEAMACGKLVVSTGVGMQGIDAEPGKHYLLADEPFSFAEQIRWALNNKEQANTISDEAQKLVRDKYDSNKIAMTLSQKVISIL